MAASEERFVATIREGLANRMGGEEFWGPDDAAVLAQAVYDELLGAGVILPRGRQCEVRCAFIAPPATPAVRS